MSVYSFNADGSLQLNTRYIIVKSKIKWWAADMAGYATILPGGPMTIEQIVGQLNDLKMFNYEPFLVIGFNSDAEMAAYKQQKGDDGPIIAYDAFNINAVILDTQNNNLAEYIPIGDVEVTDTSYDNNREKNMFLYANKRIVLNFPIKVQSSGRLIADTTSTVNNADASQLYKHIGEFFKYVEPRNINSTDQTVIAPFSVCPAILRCFITWFDTAAYKELPTVIRIRQKNGFGGFMNTRILTLSPQCYINCSVDEALTNIMDCVLNKAITQSITFQGFLNNASRSSFFAKALCESPYSDPLPKYPKFCACIGRLDVELALKRSLNNSAITLMCQSPDCVDRADGVFLLTPESPCPLLSVCVEDVSFLRNVVYDRVSCAAEALPPPPPAPLALPPPPPPRAVAEPLPPAPIPSPIVDPVPVPPPTLAPTPMPTTPEPIPQALPPAVPPAKSKINFFIYVFGGITGLLGILVIIFILIFAWQNLKNNKE